MKKIILLAFLIINNLGFSQTVNQEKLDQLSITISEGTCNCVHEIKNNNGDWVNSIEGCFLESFEKNELKVKQVLGGKYLDKENASNILYLIRFMEGFWVDKCLEKLKSEETFVPNLLFYFNENVHLTYNLVDFVYDDNGGSEEEIIEDEVFEVNGVFVKSYLDKLETQYIIVKIDNVDVHFMAYNEFDNYETYFVEKKLKINDKVSIKYSILNLFDEDKNDYVDEKRILNIEKI